MNHRNRTLLTLLGALTLPGMLAAGPMADDSTAVRVVYAITVESAITPISAEFITKSLDKAEAAGAHCFVLELDTPGGLLESTRQITKRFLVSRIPVIVYVAPEGARAASAGVFISYAAHLVAMAPSTNIGAATPINLSGGSDSTSTIGHKIVNDAVAQVKAMAEKRGRNAEWAEQAIREAVSITQSEALKLNVINFVSPSLDSLLNQLDGATVEVEGGDVTLHTRGASVEYHEMNFRYRILEKITNPNIAYILLLVGLAGLYFELSNPGAVLPGVVGAISLILAFFAMQTLPINYAGLLLIIVAIILFILEVKIVSYGLLTIGGILSMILGSLMLIEQPPDDFGNVLSISIKLIVIVAVLTAGFFVFAVSMVVRTGRKKVTTGSEGIIGEVGIAQTRLAPDGRILVHGEIWKASCDAPVKKGEKVRVVSVENLSLKVEKI